MPYPTLDECTWKLFLASYFLLHPQRLKTRKYSTIAKSAHGIADCVDKGTLTQG